MPDSHSSLWWPGCSEPLAPPPFPQPAPNSQETGSRFQKQRLSLLQTRFTWGTLKNIKGQKNNSNKNTKSWVQSHILGHSAGTRIFESSPRSATVPKNSQAPSTTLSIQSSPHTGAERHQASAHSHLLLHQHAHAHTCTHACSHLPRARARSGG